MFVKMSRRDRLICFADFVGMTLLAVLSLPPLPNSFFKICPPTSFAAVFNFFLPLLTSAIFDGPYSNESAPTRFAAGTIYLRKNGNAVLAITCASAMIKIFARISIYSNCAGVYLSMSIHFS